MKAPIAIGTSGLIRLADGRLFMPDTALVDWPDMARWLQSAQDWRRDETLYGFVGPQTLDAP
ncbi:MAG TPA: hypothetical protein VNH21_13665 [Steroidobacteraceae bacterium]|nr:hypothetical protein [Steroidobacteraceae bacterium]